MLKLLLTVFVTVCLSTASHADFIVNIIEIGQTVQFAGSGSIDLNSTLGFVNSGDQGVGHTFNAVDGALGVFAGIFPVPSDRYGISGLVTSGDFSSTALTENIGGDPSQGIFVNDFDLGSNLFVPIGYESGEQYAFTAFIDNTSFSELGFEVGDQSVLSWGNGGVTESLTLNWTTAIPEPSSSAMFFFFSAFAIKLRRRKKNLETD